MVQKLSIIIVNYKTPHLVLNCIESIYKYPTNNIEIIVVDNYSNDDTEIQLSLKYPDVKFLQVGYNAGFARANNKGLAIATGENILLLNSDTVNLNDAINQCNVLLTQSNFLAAGVQLLNADFSPQISGNYAMKGGLNYLLPLPYIGNFLKYIATILNVKKPSIEKANNTVEVDWINGAFLMIKKEILTKAGFLDEDFFLYAEEAEWCSRIKKYGKLAIYGHLNVVHLQGESANQSFMTAGKGYFNLFDKKGLQLIVSNWLRIRKEFGLGWFFLIVVIYLFTIPIFYIGVMAEKIIFPKKCIFQISQCKSYAKNMIRAIKLIPNMISNKPYFYKML